ncbi:E3 ubiquitin-protein ligase ZNRF2 isoform X1 [Manis pentadactyla]|uniref:E3 ubiquitin-protein ligase ZNRF2 isoform X1 n=1 Tax=Manis pentadactyla TaxID=143292 RepID=UPI00255C53B9|nr:E3 ubiquitin-protein ligase ZNRF2 isoform X1 [Manis pentadactyla]
MGAKQSGPAAANGRTRAYSGSDLPSSSAGGASGTAGGGGARAEAAERCPAQVSGAHQPSASGAAAAAPRSRSLGGAVGTVASGTRAAQSSFSIPNSSSGPYGSQDSVHSSPEDGGGGRDRPAGGGSGGPRLVIGSLPAHLSPHMFGGFKCPVCSKFVPSDEMDLHLVMCLTKPRITYNGIISHFSCFCFLLLSLRVQEQKISLQVKCLIHNSAWHCILLKRSYTFLDAWSENKVMMIMKFSHGVFLAASNKFGLTCYCSFFSKRILAVCFFHVVLICNNYMDLFLYLLNILILLIWLLGF